MKENPDRKIKKKAALLHVYISVHYNLVVTLQLHSKMTLFHLYGFLHKEIQPKYFKIHYFHLMFVPYNYRSFVGRDGAVEIEF